METQQGRSEMELKHGLRNLPPSNGCGGFGYLQRWVETHSVTSATNLKIREIRLNCVYLQLTTQGFGLSINYNDIQSNPRLSNRDSNRKLLGQFLNRES